MHNHKALARITGILFIIATISSLVGNSFSGPILKTLDFSDISTNTNQLIIGVLLSFIAAAASTGIAISLYPILRKYNESLAIGAVAFRLMEGIFYTIAATCHLSLLPLGQLFITQGSQNPLYFQTFGHLLLTIGDLFGFVFGVIAFCIGAMAYYWIFYASKLVPRWLSIWGIIALLLLFSAVMNTLFNGQPYTVSGNLVFLALPIALQEFALAAWLIVKGFNHPK